MNIATVYRVRRLYDAIKMAKCWPGGVVGGYDDDNGDSNGTGTGDGSGGVAYKNLLGLNNKHDKQTA